MVWTLNLALSAPDKSKRECLTSSVTFESAGNYRRVIMVTGETSSCAPRATTPMGKCFSRAAICVSLGTEGKASRRRNRWRIVVMRKLERNRFGGGT